MNGIVLEGGGMRGMFTCGVLDVLMQHGLDALVQGVVGVSAGAAFGCNLKSHQIGRALRYNKRFASDPRYMGVRSWLRTGDFVNAEFAYHTVPWEYDLFDVEAFAASPIQYHMGCTDVATARPVYRQFSVANDETLEWMRASASLPLASRPVQIGAQKFLDGGLSDSIPLRYFQQQGFRRNLVVLTQPRGFRKRRSLFNLLWYVALPRERAVARLLRRRPEMYNAQLDYLHEQELLGNTLVICPERPIAISRLATDPAQLQQAYDMGVCMAQRMLPQITRFLQKR